MTSLIIVKHEKQILIFLHRFQELLRPFYLHKVAESKDFHSNTSSQDPQNEVFDLKFSHILEYDCKTQKKIFVFFTPLLRVGSYIRSIPVLL